MRQFVHLHTHSEQTGFDGFGSVKSFVAVAAHQKAPAIAFTEHGTMRGAWSVEEVATKAGIKPIFGVEFYLSKDMRSRGLPAEEQARLRKQHGFRVAKEMIYQEEVRLGLRERNHLTILAADQTGLHNLYKLTSASWLEGFYTRPRIDIPLLTKHTEGLIVLSGCQVGPVANAILRGEPEEARLHVAMLSGMFPGRFFLEIMPHNSDAQRIVNKELAIISLETGIPLVATQDAHYPKRGDHVFQEALLCIHKHDVLMNPSRFKFDSHEYWMKSGREMYASFIQNHPDLSKSMVRDAIQRTVDIAEMSSATIKVKTPLVPNPYGVDDAGAEAIFRDLCQQGWIDRGIDARIAARAVKQHRPIPEVEAEYRNRLEHETAVIKERGAINYFLVVHDFYRWMREQKFVVGAGRGSGAGCLTAFLMGITKRDPIHDGLMFERFMAPGRQGLPDFDCDIPDIRRNEVLSYLKDKYGADRFAHIATGNAIRGRACLRDVGRIMQIPNAHINAACATLPEKYINEGDKENHRIDRSLAGSHEGMAFAAMYDHAVELATGLEGSIKSFGVHPAGVVLSPVPLDEVCPLELRKSKGKSLVVTAFDMNGVEAAGLLKIDLLGLRNLTTLHFALDAMDPADIVRHRLDDLANIPEDDASVYSAFSAGLFTGIFQFDTPLMRNTADGVRIEEFKDIAAMISITRPGVSHAGLDQEFLRAKRNRGYVPNMPARARELCHETYGVMLYQEQLLWILGDIGGFDPIRADKVRRMVGKKKGKDELGKELEEFVAGSVERGLPARDANLLSQQIVESASYLFNKSHAFCYGALGYWEMWFKVHFPMAFARGLLATANTDEKKIAYRREAMSLGATIAQPCVNDSSLVWELRGNTLIPPLGEVKGIGPAAVQAILDMRPYTSLEDFLTRIDRRRCNSRVFGLLASVGALRNLPSSLPRNVSPNEIWQKTKPRHAPTPRKRVISESQTLLDL